MTYQARPGDVYLLCSDGLTTMIREDRIAAVLAGAHNLEEAVSRLVREANEAGGRDNITVVAFRLDEAGAPAEVEGQPTLIGPTAEEAGLTADAVAARPAAGEGAEPPGLGSEAESCAAPPAPPGWAGGPAGSSRRSPRCAVAVGLVVAGAF